MFSRSARVLLVLALGSTTVTAGVVSAEARATNSIAKTRPVGRGPTVAQPPNMAYGGDPKTHAPKPKQTKLKSLGQTAVVIRIPHGGKPGAPGKPDAIIVKPGGRPTNQVSKPFTPKSPTPSGKPSVAGKPIRIPHNGKPGSPANPDAVIVKSEKTPTNPNSKKFKKQSAFKKPHHPSK
ncbi:hypothetical protein C8R43DRAFT_1134148 [Mycena crocata]|nr:hypothetical protein C8R43DRAFT_1134148 [Mycena crocata]